MSKSSQAGLVTIRRAAEILDCGMSTLRTWDREGKLTAVRTPGGQRRYRIEDLERFQGINRKLAPKSKSVAIYCRVSSHEQKAKGDLDRQKARLLEHCVKKQYRVTQVLDEVGSGMNDARPKMLKLFDLAVRGEIGRVVVDHKDRLTRFNFNIFKVFLASHGVAVEWLEDVLPKSYEAELVEDMVSLMSSFSARVYMVSGRRKTDGKRRPKQRERPSEEVPVLPAAPRV